MKEKTLLEKAKGVKGNRTPQKITDEHIELALAWVNGEVPYSAVNIALGKPKVGSHAYTFLALTLKAHLLKTKQ